MYMHIARYPSVLKVSECSSDINLASGSWYEKLLCMKTVLNYYFVCLITGDLWNIRFGIKHAFIGFGKSIS